MKKPEIILVTVTKRTATERWTLFLSDHEDGRVLASVQLNQEISRYIRSTLSMIEDELPEQN